MGAIILESSETVDLENVLTIKAPRGEEYTINADALAKAFAVLLSDHSNEIRNGWSLSAAWWREEFEALCRAAIVTPPEAP